MEPQIVKNAIKNDIEICYRKCFKKCSQNAPKMELKWSLKSNFIKHVSQKCPGWSPDPPKVPKMTLKLIKHGVPKWPKRLKKLPGRSFLYPCDDLGIDFLTISPQSSPNRMTKLGTQHSERYSSKSLKKLCKQAQRASERSERRERSVDMEMIVFLCFAFLRFAQMLRCYLTRSS